MLSGSMKLVYTSIRFGMQSILMLDQVGILSGKSSLSLRGGEHETIKPVALLTHYIVLSSQPGDLVLDPFMGSGSTGLAAVANHRRFLGIELNPKYYQIAAGNLENDISK